MSFLFLCTLSLLLSESCCNLLCYNCSTTQHDPGAACVTAFQNHGLLSAETIQQLNAITVNCSKEAAFCFVRSSHSRARFAWLVQRGCYYPQSDKELSFLRSRCSHSQNTICDSLRKADSEYSMCLCNADHCNSAEYSTLRLKSGNNQSVVYLSSHATFVLRLFNFILSIGILKSTKLFKNNHVKMKSCNK